MNQIQKIDDGFTFHQFGPILANFKLSNKFIVELNKRGSHCHLDYKKNLAGHINNEYKFSDDDTKWFLEETKDIFSLLDIEKFNISTLVLNYISLHLNPLENLLYLNKILK